ncbi:MAG: pyridoxal-phosphate dependent enzyme, partial [Pseudomonadales bacterium]
MKLPPRKILARLPTPLIPLERLSSIAGGPRIWLKRDDTTDTTASGNKLRKLEFSVGQALADGADVLITCGGVQSNHCRATAVVASQLGLGCHLILRGRPDSPIDGNLLLDRLLGAETRFITAAEWAEIDAIFADTAAEYRAKGRQPFSIPTGASDEIGLWGYITACEELKDDFARHNIEPGYVVSAAGSGGTLGGLILGGHLHNLETRMLAFNVCDDEAYFVNKIREDITKWQLRYDHAIDETLPIDVIDGYVGPGYGRADDHVFETIAMVARTEGVVFDPVYT